jgi:DUF917 family protein
MTQGETTTLDAQALEDIMNGACILASGGGGALTEGKLLVAELTSHGAPPVTLIEPEDVPAAAWMAVSAAIGSPTAASDVKNLARVAVAAYDALGAARGVTLTHVLVGEIGAVNALVPMLPASSKGLPLVDASGAPRALPLLANCIFADTVPISPIALSNGQDTITVTAPNAELADPILRGVISSSVFPDYGGFALWAMDGPTMQKQALPGTLTRARKLGETLRTAPAGQKVQAVCSFLGGTVLFTGKKFNASEQSGGGFDVGTVTLTALDGKTTLTIYEQNENLIAWRSDRSAPVAMAPDLICYLTADGRPFSNAEPDVKTIKPDTEVAVIGVSAASLDFATPAVVASFARLLAATGYPGPFTPLKAPAGAAV